MIVLMGDLSGVSDFTVGFISRYSHGKREDDEWFTDIFVFNFNIRWKDRLQIFFNIWRKDYEWFINIYACVQF